MNRQDNRSLKQNSFASSFGKTDANDHLQLVIKQSIATYHSSNDFIYKLFEAFHISNGWPSSVYSRDVLFTDSYLGEVLASGIPSEFRLLTEDQCLTTPATFKSELVKHKEEKATELKLFTALKHFFRDRNVDLTDSLKQIRVMKQANCRNDFQKWEKAYWQLLYIIVTAFFLDHSQNDFLDNFFEVSIKQDVSQLKIVIEIANSVLKRTLTQEPVNKFAQNSSIMIIDQQKSEPAIITTQDIGDLEQNGHYLVQSSEVFIGNGKPSESSQESLGTDGTDEDDEDLLKQDITHWDVFDDYHKFQERDKILKQRQKQIAQEEIQQIELQKMQEVESKHFRKFELEIERLENKLKIQEESIKKKNDREQLLLSELNIIENKVEMKQVEIENLNNKMIFYETFKHKYEVKSKETERLLGRVEGLSQANGSFEEQIQKQKFKNTKLASEIDDLKEKIKLLKQNQTSNELSCFADDSLDSSQFKKHEDVKLRIKGHNREESKNSAISEYSQQAYEDSSKRVDSLQDELTGSPDRYGDLQMDLNLKTKPSIDDEELFGESTFRSQYRFETTEDELACPNDDIMSAHNEDHGIDPEYMDSDFLRQEYLKEKTEKQSYRKQYLELQERCFHYQQMMEEYEHLYTEFLTKSIRAEKQKIELQLKLRKFNWLQSSTASALVLGSKIRERPLILGAIAVFLIAFLALIVFM